MIGWLFDFIFSNIWILFILLWVFRSLSKGATSQPRHQPQRPIAPMPIEIPWEIDMERPKRKPNVQPRPIDTPPETASGTRQQPHKERKQPLAESREEESGRFPSPVEGMIWSQVYGPPRAKLPHYSRRK